jgi:hypothetical protein
MDASTFQAFRSRGGFAESTTTAVGAPPVRERDDIDYSRLETVEERRAESHPFAPEGYPIGTVAFTVWPAIGTHKSVRAHWRPSHTKNVYRITIVAVITLFTMGVYRYFGQFWTAYFVGGVLWLKAAWDLALGMRATSINTYSEVPTAPEPRGSFFTYGATKHEIEEEALVQSTLDSYKSNRRSARDAQAAVDP